MRADWFLPVLRSPKPDVPERRIGFLARTARRVLPAKCFSERTTKQRGWFRRFLRWLGPVWLSAPCRRSVQGICFVTFLWLFFVTCWPYSATPARSSTGWIPADFDFEQHSVLLVSEEGRHTDNFLERNKNVFVRDDSAGLNGDVTTVPFEIVSLDDAEVLLQLAFQEERTSNIEHSTSNIEGGAEDVRS